jgi:hypothetical protein
VKDAEKKPTTLKFVITAEGKSAETVLKAVEITLKLKEELSAKTAGAKSQAEKLF